MQYPGLGTKSISADKLITTESRQAAMPLKHKSSSEKKSREKNSKRLHHTKVVLKSYNKTHQAFHYEPQYTHDPPLNAS